MKLIIIGHARHGKDTAAEYLEEKYGGKFASSSMHNAEKTVFPVLAPLYGYTTVEECFEDRGAHRSEWYNLIAARCADDPATIGREIFEISDIYAGLRNKREFHGIVNAGLVDHTIWIDRSDHLPPEPKSSMTIEPWMTDYIVDNNGSLEDLYFNIDTLYNTLLHRSGATSAPF